MPALIFNAAHILLKSNYFFVYSDIFCLLKHSFYTQFYKISQMRKIPISQIIAKVIRIMQEHMQMAMQRATRQ